MCVGDACRAALRPSGIGIQGDDIHVDQQQIAAVVPERRRLPPPLPVTDVAGPCEDSHSLLFYINASKRSQVSVCALKSAFSPLL